VDTFLYQVLFFACFAVVASFQSAMLSGLTLSEFVILILAQVGCPVLFACKDGFGGLSPGKWALGVQVLDAKTRAPAGFWASFKRNLVLVIPYLSVVAVLIIIVQLGRGRIRRWGDGWAGTIVVWRAHENKLPFNPAGFVCFECGYDLTGNVSGICPECGTPIPPKASTA